MLFFFKATIPSREEVASEMEYFNTEILQKLLSSTSKSQNKRATIQISERLFTFLKNNYNLKQNSYKWTDGSNILKEFSFDIKRYFNQTDYCCIKEASFKIRIFQKYRKYFGGKNLTLKKKPFKHALTFKFQNLSLKDIN